MTYAELVTQIQTYLENTETTFVDQIPNFVKLAEERIYHDTQLPVARQSSTATLTASVRYLGQPTDFLAPYEMSVLVAGVYSPVIYTDVSFIREAYPDPTVTGVPLHYATWDQNSFVVGPTPASNYTAELHYFRLPESIVTASTTWLGTNAPGALLYGSLIEGYVYNKGEVDMFQVYDRRYKEAIGLLKLLSAGKVRGDTYRDGQFKTPVEM
jgi:hypothetical protein